VVLSTITLTRKHLSVQVQLHYALSRIAVKAAVTIQRTVPSTLPAMEALQPAPAQERRVYSVRVKHLIAQDTHSAMVQVAVMMALDAVSSISTTQLCTAP